MSGQLDCLKDWKGYVGDPTPFDGKLFFLSNRGLNFFRSFWAIDLNARRLRQVIRFTDHDISWPLTGSGGITFQQGGDLYRLDSATEKLTRLHGDLPRATPTADTVPASEIVRDALGGLDCSLSPDGAALLVSAHGGIVRISAQGRGEDLRRAPAIDEDHPTWSPDGLSIAYTTNASGEQQIAVRPASGGPVRLPALVRRPGCFYSVRRSPAGDQFAYSSRRYSVESVIGTRTWGGVQGIHHGWSLMDGTGTYFPKDALADRDGHWLVENEVVAPDILVDTGVRESESDSVDLQIVAAVRAGLPRLPVTSPLPTGRSAWLSACPSECDVPGTSSPVPSGVAR